MSHYQVRFQERRFAERKRLTGLMPGKFQIDGRDVSARAVDISEHGLGVLISEEHLEGVKAALIIKDEIIPLEIKWRQPDFGKHDLWRYGLVCTDLDMNLLDLFEKTGCFK